MMGGDRMSKKVATIVNYLDKETGDTPLRKPKLRPI